MSNGIHLIPAFNRHVSCTSSSRAPKFLHHRHRCQHYRRFFIGFCTDSQEQWMKSCVESGVENICHAPLATMRFIYKCKRMRMRKKTLSIFGSGSSFVVFFWVPLVAFISGLVCFCWSYIATVDCWTWVRVCTTRCIYLVNISYRIFSAHFFLSLCHKETTCTPVKWRVADRKKNNHLTLHPTTWDPFLPIKSSHTHMNSYVFPSKERCDRSDTHNHGKCQAHLRNGWKRKRHEDTDWMWKRRNEEVKPNTPRSRTTKQTKGNKNREREQARERICYIARNIERKFMWRVLLSRECVCIFLRQQLSPRVIIYRFYAHFLSAFVSCHFFIHSFLLLHVCQFRCSASASFSFSFSFEFVWFHFVFLLCAPKWATTTTIN